MKTPLEKHHELVKHLKEKYADSDSEVEDGVVLVFWKQYEEEGFLYPFCAIKGRGLWFVTGLEGGLKWIDLLAFYEEDNHLPNLKEGIKVATEFDLLFMEDE
jgi:hypothetical protein